MSSSDCSVSFSSAWNNTTWINIEYQNEDREFLVPVELLLSICCISGSFSTFRAIWILDWSDENRLCRLFRLLPPGAGRLGPMLARRRLFIKVRKVSVRRAQPLSIFIETTFVIVRGLSGHPLFDSLPNDLQYYLLHQESSYLIPFLYHLVGTPVSHPEETSLWLLRYTWGS